MKTKSKVLVGNPTAKEGKEESKEKIEIVPETPQQREQRLFTFGNRKTRRMIAKRNKFFKDKSHETWLEANRQAKEVKKKIDETPSEKA